MTGFDGLWRFSADDVVLEIRQLPDGDLSVLATSDQDGAPIAIDVRVPADKQNGLLFALFDAAVESGDAVLIVDEPPVTRGGYDPGS